MPHTFTSLLAHIIFSTKDRAPLIAADVQPQLHAYMGGILRELKATPLIVNGVNDHVHLLVGLPPTASVSDTLRLLKANSSRWLHETYRKPFAWQSGYGAFSVSRSNLEAVRKYIAHQEEHHRRMSFKEEFMSLLRKHNIEFDEQFIWN
ncbi:MAG: REP-associated tyrosine transposase [Acidobacteriota bacterium]|jgi:REP element-mobilizing transposase RayT|nr:REP-associated tyrosine transposase [Acidobacteriota bacterium]MDT7780112.1 REP-associated tyrosine transposase [Acidobacteriota bacterium]